MVYKKEFDNWNKKKKAVDNRERNVEFEEGRMYWCNLGVNVGTEMDGKNKDFTRPVLVIKKFTKEEFWGVPLTTKSKESFGKLNTHLKEMYHVLGDRDKDSLSLLALRQLKLLNVKRILKKVLKNDFDNKVSKEDLKTIKIKIDRLLS